jgi:hypothetical protein
MDFKDGSNSSEERRISGQERWMHAPGVAGSAVAVGSILAQLLFGMFALLKADSDWLTLGGTILVIFGASEAAWILHFISKASTWSPKDRPTDFEVSRRSIDALETILNSDVSRLEIKAQTLRALHDLRTQEIERLTLSRMTIDADKEEKVADFVSVVTTGRDSLSRHSSVFYVGLLVGFLGTAVAVYGLVSKLYPSTLTGSIIASIGFLSLACALLSAEDKIDASSG